MRYAQSRFYMADMEEIYRTYAARHLQLLAGTNLSYGEIVHGDRVHDFDAEQVVDDVASRICREG